MVRGVPFDGLPYRLYRAATMEAAERLDVRVLFYQFETEADLQVRFKDFATNGDQALLIWGIPISTFIDAKSTSL